MIWSRPHEHYAYAFNNPLSFTDPRGLYGGGLAPGWKDPYGVNQRRGDLVPPKPVKDFVLQGVVGANEVLNPIQPPGGFAMPDSDAGVAGRIAGRTAGLIGAFVEIQSGVAIAEASVGGGLVAALPSGGTSAVPAGAGVAVGGALVIKGAYDIKRAIELPGVYKMEAQGSGAGEKVGQRAGPSPENYRGRYNAERHAEGKSRLPDDWDAHHRIPQEYMEHPEFKGFDFHAPSNVRGVKGSRADVNVHQQVTNRWADFRAQKPAATRAEIEAFAEAIENEFASQWLK